jgi:hypothetical protein
MAWYGLTLPTVRAKPRTWRLAAADQTPGNRLQRIVDVVLRRGTPVFGYAVWADEAVEILSRTRPDAAEWWGENAQQLLTGRQVLIFDKQACEPVGEQTGGTIRIPSRFKRRFPASPGRIAGLWALATVVGMADAILFFWEDGASPIGTLHRAGTSIFAGLVAAWIMRLRGSALHLLSAMASLTLFLGLGGAVIKLAVGPSYGEQVDQCLLAIQCTAIAYIISAGFLHLCGPQRRLTAIVAAIGIIFGANALEDLDMQFWRLSSEVRRATGHDDRDSDEADETSAEIAPDVLWGAQPTLVERQIAGFGTHVAGKKNIYLMAVAASGGQALFGREAHAVLEVAGKHFGSASRGGVLLSNAAADQMKAPLATRANMASAAKAIDARADPAGDVIFVYLASHGSRAAELSTNLASYQSVQAITSKSVAEVLRPLNVKRRIIVVSACYAATWIPALADDDTIVIAAAAKDRTSFGCDDTRQFTVFGEAFLQSLASPTASLRDVFESAKRKIAAEETKEQVTPSLPQAFVGRNMAKFWLGTENIRTR